MPTLANSIFCLSTWTEDLETNPFVCVSQISIYSEPEVRHHLVRVYACLTATTALAAVGALCHLLNYWQAGILTALGSVGLAITLSMMQESPKNFYTRLSMLLGFGFLTGNSIGPLLDRVIALNPQIVVTAFFGTSIVFVALSCSALLARRGSFLVLGGILMSFLSTFALISLANIFMQSQLVYQVGKLFRYYLPAISALWIFD